MIRYLLHDEGSKVMPVFPVEFQKFNLHILIPQIWFRLPDVYDFKQS